MFTARYGLIAYIKQITFRLSKVDILKSSHSSYLSAYEDGTECSETSAYKIQTAGNYPGKKHTTFRTGRKFEIMVVQ